jgi:ribulose-5-phosphate 4-epimerase/fuculose-1-phosphate aldolase
MNEAQARDDICRYGRSLFERGLTPGSSGNISARLQDGTVLATPTNASLGFLDPRRLSHISVDGRLLSGDQPTKEMPLHSALYETRRNARAIVHLHSTYSVAVSMLPEIDPARVLPPLTAYYVMRVGDAVLLPYYRPGDPAIVEAIRSLRGEYAALLLANHGPVVAGETLDGAVNAIEEFEETAKLYLTVRGTQPRQLTAEQIADLAKSFNLKLRKS